MTQPRRGLRHISDILRDITEADQPAHRPEPRHPFSRHCPCGRCMSRYLRSTSKEAA